ncbi:MAG: NADH-quinone oxidoreductase subunit C [Actinomycetota bacterium]|nr:NADH-quinone oxidoreductase subunit C [Actinomycetota bacterium]
MPVIDRVDVDEAARRVQTALGSKASEVTVNFDSVEVTCRPDNLVDVMTTLRDADGIRCRYFCFLSGVDRSEYPVEEGEEQPQLELLVRVSSPEHVVHVTVHVALEMTGAVVPSISGVYRGALWHERECHEMFGIDFEGHPRLVGIYLPEDFEGHPGLRSFKLPARTVVKEWPGAKDPDEAAAGGR